ncbi:unnamed protein product [Agarophyton chilense]
MGILTAFAFVIILLVTALALPLGEQSGYSEASARLFVQDTDIDKGNIDRQMMSSGTGEEATPSPSYDPDEEDGHDGEEDHYNEDGHDNEIEDDESGDQGLEDIMQMLQQCFPGNSNVEVENIGTVRMNQLESGHKVAQMSGDSSEVFSFTHKLGSGVFRFKKLCSVEKCVTASPGHYIFSKDKLVAAGSVRIGDYLQMGNGSLVRVSSVENVWRRGLYNPQTVSGELVVDGFRVSSYTMAVRPNVAQTLLAPLRAAYRVLGTDITGGTLANIGAPWIGAAALGGKACIGLSGLSC